MRPPFAVKLEADREALGEGHMIRVFVVLSWAAFALRQIFVKPVKALARDFQSR